MLWLIALEVLRAVSWTSATASSPGPHEALMDVHANPREIRDMVRVHADLARAIVARQRNCDDEVVDVSRQFLALLSNATAGEVSDDDDEIAALSLSSHPLNLLYLFGFWRSVSAPVLRRRDVSSLAGDGGGVDEAEVRTLLSNLPGERQWRDVGLSVIRLQSVYNISTEQLLEGSLAGERAFRPLRKEECFLLAHIAGEALLRDLFRSWFEACARRFVTFDVERAARERDLADKLDKLDAELAALPGDQGRAEAIHQTLPMDLMASLVPPNASAAEASGSGDLFNVYRQLCQSESQTTSLLPSEEHCLYYDMGEAFGKLAPAKLEFLAYDPVVAVAHQFLGPKLLRSINDAVDAGEANLDLPKSVSSSTGRIHSSAGRTGLVGFLPHAPRGLARAASRLTGLSMAGAEALQVVSYGIGGHYEPHVDFFGFNSSTAASEAFGAADGDDRTATLLCYLNRVDAGGATVFPRLGLAVRPDPGAALFWYNLYRNGSGDPFTLHAACPVLRGEKRVANQWFRQVGQAHQRPCPIRNDAE